MEGFVSSKDNSGESIHRGGAGANADLIYGCPSRNMIVELVPPVQRHFARSCPNNVEGESSQDIDNGRVSRSGKVPKSVPRFSTLFGGSLRGTAQERSPSGTGGDLRSAVPTSVRFSEIARSLEEGIRLKKVMERMSRQWKWKVLRQRVRRNLLKMGTLRLGR